MDVLLASALFVLGLIFGSFLNVCIYRIPRDESVVSPPSHCPECNASIRWRDNVPLIGWIVLRGRCRRCGKPISFRYPAVEFLLGALFVGCYFSFGWQWLTLKFCVFSFLVLGLIFMDAETGLLPREFTYSGIVVGLILSWIAPSDSGTTAFLLRAFGRGQPGVHTLGLIDSFVAAFIAAGFFYVVWALYFLVRKRHGLGFGDIALMAMCGAFLGLKLVILVIFLAPVAALIFVAGMFLWEAFRPKQNEDEVGFMSREIPFGVFLGSGALAAVFVGEAVWRWYLGYLHIR